MSASMSRKAFLGLTATFGVNGMLGLSGCRLAPGSDPTASDGSSSDSSDSSSDGSSASTPSSSEPELLTRPLENGFGSGMHHATIEVADFGAIELELNANNTPITVSNFADLVQSGFYDGLTFHRIIGGFMIQGGDPNGDGTGGSARRIKGEFSENGIVNAIQHKRGVISMARSNDANSASSQFFIMHADSSSLDGKYAAFGRVTSGLEVIDAICEKIVPTDSNGTVPKDQQPRITSMAMVD